MQEGFDSKCWEWYNKMSLLTTSEFVSCDLLCSELTQHPEVLFTGFVNNKGRMLTCMKNNSLDFHNEKSLEVFAMETALDLSMKNEFNDVLGNTEYTVTKRKNTHVVCIPINSLILVVVADNHTGLEVVKKIYSLLPKFPKDNV